MSTDIQPYEPTPEETAYMEEHYPAAMTVIGPSFDPDGPGYEYRQSATACCPRETIPDSCSCPDGCGCHCMDCDCWTVELADKLLG